MIFRVSVKWFVSLLLCLCGCSLYSQTDTIFAEIEKLYTHTHDPNEEDDVDDWLYIFDTGNDCSTEREYIIDFITFTVPDRFKFYNADTGELIYDTFLVGSDCRNSGAPPSIPCRSGYFVRESNGDIIEWNFPHPGFMYLNPYYVPGRFNMSMGFTVRIKTSARFLHMYAFPNPRLRTVFQVMVHPPILHVGDVEDIIHKFVYVCNRADVAIDTVFYGNPCDSIIFTHFIYRNRIESEGIGIDTLVLKDSRPFMYRAPKWLNDVTIDGVQIDYIIIYPANEQEYKIFGCDGYGCCGTGKIIVRLYEDDTYIPNVFSPNGDGINDHFEFFTKDVVVNYKWRIFNRWGGLIYEGNEHWNGEVGNHGEVCQVGVYVYVLDIQYFTGHSKQFSGDITLVR